MHPIPAQNSLPKSYHYTLSRGKILFAPGSIFFVHLFSTAAERGGENYDLLYQNSTRKYEDDLEHQVIYILYRFKCNNLQFCK